MAGGGRRLCYSGAREERQGVFYRPAALQGGFAELSLATVATAWARRRLATCGGRRPMDGGGSPAGKCGKVAWHRPRPFARVTSLRCTVPTALGLGPRGIPTPRRACALGVGRRPTWRAQRDVTWEHALWRKQFHVAVFKTIFLQNSKQKCTKV
jgi:hypothetical protein